MQTETEMRHLADLAGLDPKDALRKRCDEITRDAKAKADRVEQLEVQLRASIQQITVSRDRNRELEATMALMQNQVVELMDRNAFLEHNDESMQGTIDGLEEQIMSLESGQEPPHRRSESPGSSSSEFGASDFRGSSLLRERDELRREVEHLRAQVAEVGGLREELVKKQGELAHLQDVNGRWQVHSQQQTDAMNKLRSELATAAQSSSTLHTQVLVNI